MNYFWTIVVFAVVLGGHQIFGDSGTKIVGGKLIEIDEVPHQVMMLNEGRHRCGGSIISSTWIFTAAHCTYRLNASLITFRAGSAHKYQGGQIFQVKQVVEHEDYDPFMTNFDFSLVELTKPIQFTQTMKAIRLPSAEYLVRDGSTALVSGWGNTQTSENQDWLRAAEIFVVDNQRCRELYAVDGYVITDNMLCAGLYEGGKDSCQGDSGGPIIQNGQLIGVVSWGKGCALRGFPGVYARTNYVRDWVKQVTGI